MSFFVYFKQKKMILQEPDYTITGGYITDLQILQEALPVDFEKLKKVNKQFYYLATDIKFANQLYRERCILHYKKTYDKLQEFDEFFKRKELNIFFDARPEVVEKCYLSSWKDIYYFYKDFNNYYIKPNQQSTINCFIYYYFFNNLNVKFLSMKAIDYLFLYGKMSKPDLTNRLKEIIEVSEFIKIEPFCGKYIFRYEDITSTYFYHIHDKVQNSEILHYLTSKYEFLLTFKKQDKHIIDNCIKFITTSFLSDKKKIYLLNLYLKIYSIRSNSITIRSFKLWDKISPTLVSWCISKRFIFKPNPLENLYDQKRYDLLYPIFNMFSMTKDFRMKLEKDAQKKIPEAIDLLNFNSIELKYYFKFADMFVKHFQIAS